MKHKFKIGDTVRRVSGEHCGMIAGDTGTVTAVSEFGNVELAEYRYGCDVAGTHDDKLFVLVGVTSRKDDSGKLDMTLLDDMPNAIKAVVEVMQWAVTKKQPVPYERGSWQGVHADRYRAAIARHNRDACSEAVRTNAKPARLQRDNETELLHLAHIACSALMALENTIREIEEQNNAI